MPAGRVATRVATSRCVRLSAFESTPGGRLDWGFAAGVREPLVTIREIFVSALCPLYMKQGGRQCLGLMLHRLQKLRHLRSYSISSNLICAHDVNAWGARGPEFKSRRSDHQNEQSRKCLWPSTWPICISALVPSDPWRVGAARPRVIAAERLSSPRHNGVSYGCSEPSLPGCPSRHRRQRQPAWIQRRARAGG